MKIYPQTAPEIPTGESSIGWEAGEAGWATVPPHHPPRGSGTVSANSRGSPGLRKQGLGPWQEGRVPERGGGQGASTGLSPAQPRSAGSQLWWRWAKGQTHTCAYMCTLEAPALPWSLPSITASARGSPEVGDRVRDAKALGEVASSFKYPLGQPPCCLDGDHYCFRGTGKGKSCSPGQESRKRRAAPLYSAGSSGWGLALGKLPSRFHSFLHTRGCWGWDVTLPCPSSGPGAPPQAVRWPKGRVGGRLCPSCLPAGVQTQSQDKKILW